MADAAFAAEDKIESYVTERIRTGSSGNGNEGYTCFCQDLEEVIKEMDHVIQGDMEAKEKNAEMDHLPRNSMRKHPDGMIKVVGLHREMEELRERIFNELRRQILPVIGMGGIGKTTLTRSVYNIPYVRCSFEVKAWAMISQDYTLGDIIRALLDDIGVDETDCIDDEDLGDKLYKCLYNIKYLIVLDDIWDVKVWFMIMRFFPDNTNGSRIMLITRLSDVAGSVGSCPSYEVKLLDHAKSWNLFCEVVFGLEDFPSEWDELERMWGENRQELQRTSSNDSGGWWAP